MRNILIFYKTILLKLVKKSYIVTFEFLIISGGYDV